MKMWPKIKSNKLFRLLSSVKLAVPLLIIVALAVLAGTLIESRYNAEFAKLMVYESDWFFGLFILLGLNIAFAALSRIPYKLHHTGFVVTHLGMIILLIGSWLTFKDGIDGVMSVQEGQNSSSVVINERVIELVGEKFFKKMLIERSAFTKGPDTFKEVNAQFGGMLFIESYYPFVSPAYINQNGTGKVLSFTIKSDFFNQNVSLPIESGSETSMGPAIFRLIPYGEPGFTMSPAVAPAAKPKRFPSNAEKKQDLLAVKEKKSGKLIREVKLNKDPGTLKFGDLTVKIVRKFKNGTVVDNKIVEGGGEGNPVLELEILARGKKLREILYASYPEFSMNNKENLAYSFTYVAGSLKPAETSLPAGHVPIGDHGNANPPASGSRSNVIEFQLLEAEEVYRQKLAAGSKVSVKVLLIKNDKLVSEKIMNIGESFETPWMKMTLTLNSLQLMESRLSSQVPEVLSGPEEFSNNLPPSALVVRLGGSSGPLWLVEGQVQEVEIDGQQFRAYYGKNVIRLPFALHLDQFVKNDYLGTETPMSYESHVRVNSGSEKIKISMNEPLKREGFTLYQSSYQLIPNAPAVSVFSVNQDPGRWVKYIGSLIMILGIAIYALMRSRIYRSSQG